MYKYDEKEDLIDFLYMMGKGAEKNNIILMKESRCFYLVEKAAGVIPPPIEPGRFPRDVVVSISDREWFKDRLKVYCDTRQKECKFVSETSDTLKIKVLPYGSEESSLGFSFHIIAKIRGQYEIYDIVTYQLNNGEVIIYVER